MARARTYQNVWDALEDDPVERASLTVRSDLMIALEQTIERWKVTQKEAASRLGISQPRLNDLLKGRINKFSLDALVDLATRAGLSVTVKVKKQAA
ncbi:MAG TPA: XRE family transcriptional regulator [Rhizomicrobium sp.]|nr:XRE family transcriptional regulator [Rhizomicrobium sp.]